MLVGRTAVLFLLIALVVTTPTTAALDRPVGAPTSDGPDTTLPVHPRLVTPSLPWVLSVYGNELQVYVHAGAHEAGWFTISHDRSLGADRELAKARSSNFHTVHALETGAPYMRLLVEVTRPMYVAILEDERFAVSHDAALHIPCDGRVGAVLWHPPASARIRADRPDGAPGAALYARPDHHDLWLEDGFVGSERRLANHDTYWVVYQGGQNGCGSSLSLTTAEPPMVLRSPVPIAASTVGIIGLALFAWAPGVPMPALPRRGMGRR